MPAIFSQQRGMVAVLTTESMLPTYIELQGLRDTVGFAAIITGSTIQARDGVQVTHSLREFLYYYSFGPRSQAISLQGLAFAGVCAQQRGSGLERGLAYFDQYRLSNTGKLVTISLGAFVAVKGAMLDFNYQGNDPSTGVGMFTMTFACLPRPSFSLPPLVIPNILLGAP